MNNNSAIKNRLIKNQKKLNAWLKSEDIEAYRLYDKDIPEYPYIIDVYKDHALIYEKGLKDEYVDEEIRTKHIGETFEAIKEALKIPESNIVLKKREKKKGKVQYEKEDDSKNFFIVKEGPALFKVNLYDYLDTGLFLDHRPLRKIIRKSCKGKEVLNLFSYTGSISIAAAIGGGHVTTVDMSKTYINWAKDNFRLNHQMIDGHLFIAENTFDFLRVDEKKYDIIILDPPSFSNSKRMDGTFDVGRDHAGLIHLCMNRLNNDGVLYFSNNFRKFKIDEDIKKTYEVHDITEKTIPMDFRDQKIHVCFKITK